MDQYEEYFEEVSDQEEEVGVVRPIPVVAVAPLNVEVAEISDNPESPSPEPSPAVSPPVASPPGSPVGGVTSFMGFILTMTLPSWNNGQLTLGLPGRIRLVGSMSPMLYQIYKTFLRHVFGTQW